MQKSRQSERKICRLCGEIKGRGTGNGESHADQIAVASVEIFGINRHYCAWQFLLSAPRKCPPPPIKVTTDLPHTLSTSPYPFYVTIPKRLKVEVSRQKATIPHLDGFSLFFSVCPPDLIDECSVGCVKCGGGGGGGPRSNPNRISIYVH